MKCDFISTSFHTGTKPYINSASSESQQNIFSYISTLMAYHVVYHWNTGGWLLHFFQSFWNIVCKNKLHIQTFKIFWHHLRSYYCFWRCSADIYSILSKFKYSLTLSFLKKSLVYLLYHGRKVAAFHRS